MAKSLNERMRNFAQQRREKTYGFTAAQIEAGELEALGKRIAAHLSKMRGYEAKAQEKAGVELKKADDHWNTLTQFLADVKAKCDGGGFKVFQSKYCPDLSRSRIYELLAIGTGKKTLEETRAAKRARVAKRRRRVSATGDVADREVKRAAARKAWTDSADAMASASSAAASNAEKQTSKPGDTKSRSANVADSALQEFDGHLLRLLQMTAKVKASRFVNIAGHH